MLRACPSEKLNKKSNKKKSKNSYQNLYFLFLNQGIFIIFRCSSTLRYVPLTTTDPVVLGNMGVPVN